MNSGGIPPSSVSIAVKTSKGGGLCDRGPDCNLAGEAMNSLGCDLVNTVTESSKGGGLAAVFLLHLLSNEVSFLNIRGLGKSYRRAWVKEHILVEDLDIVALQETIK